MTTMLAFIVAVVALLGVSTGLAVPEMKSALVPQPQPLDDSRADVKLVSIPMCPLVTGIQLDVIKPCIARSSGLCMDDMDCDGEQVCCPADDCGNKQCVKKKKLTPPSHG
ncbi:uncharacterized protein LOC108670797 [Hyalella azteca]|uniref:Uncharacterized protein LOC108670797 n=1 Tax=Hyalella azteca TaxID=294128 RepID=A0A8B7NJF4_HYAAZ|nr:uncharacterized protein LOC108670797 [Hyalella azteca]